MTHPSFSSHRPLRSTRGFTLIEMLVVIAIIAILISLISPAITNTLEQARSTACTSNMKQIADAMLMFTSEHEGGLPFFQSPSSSAPNYVSWAGELVEGGYIDAPMQEDQDDVPSKSVFLCPSGDNSTTWEGHLPSDPWSDNPEARRPWASAHALNGELRFVHTGYALNARTENYGWPFIRHSNPNAPRTTLMSVYLPTSTVMIHDGVWTHNSAPQRIYARHGTPRRYTNMAFMDGSVRRFTTRIFDTGDTTDREVYPRFRLYRP
jgi:prepilin-type N-terminal cleavage/methylation domain-containing protein/prepilin-type processing-associated H-X9-DG protein